MADELNIPTHRYYQPRNNIKLAKGDFSKQWIYDSGIQKIDAWINSQPWGNAFSPTALFALAEPGVWYDPSDVANLDWRRNQLLWSEQYDNANWTKTAATIDANVIAAPNGTMTADKIVETAATSAHSVAPPAFLYAAGTQYTFSAYFKAAERTWVLLQFASAPFGASTRVWFDLSAGVTGFTQNCTPVITPVGDGWYRCSITATTTVGGAQSSPVVACVSTADAITSYLGVLGSGLYAWGAQLELGSTASTYQPITDLNTEVIALFPNATLYQDRAGTTLVTTPGQFVGVRLDKSKGLVLGSELVTNGDFATDTVWAKGVGWSISGGVASITSSAASNTIVQSIGVAGRVYQITYTIVSVSAFGFRSLAGGVNGAIRTVAGTYTDTIVCGTSNAFVGIAAWTTGTTGSIDNVSVKEVTGNHSVAPTDAARMTYGIEPKTGTRNILTFTEQYDNAIWSKLNLLAFGSGSTANAIAAPDGTTTADLITPTTSTLGSGASQTYNNTVSQAHTLSFSVKANGTDFVQLLWHNTLSTDFANFNITTGAVTAGTYTAATITDQGNGWFRCTITSTLAVANNVVSLYIIPTAISSRGAAYTGDGIKGVYVWGGQLERSATATAYQRVVAASDVTEAGVASCHYVQYDGTDDSMSTAAIDFTATDAMSVFAGVWKRTDAALGNLLELSVDAVNTAGTFAMRAPNTTASAAYSYLSRGTALAQVATPTTFPAPRYNLVSGLSDISDDQSVIRVNGTQVASSTSDQGTGNYGNHQLFIGRRNNASLQFAGRDYGIIIVGKSLSAGDLASTEAWLADKTPGVTL